MKPPNFLRPYPQGAEANRRSGLHPGKGTMSPVQLGHVAKKRIPLGERGWLLIFFLLLLTVVVDCCC